VRRNGQRGLLDLDDIETAEQTVAAVFYEDVEIIETRQ
jgi:hypothetical protein